MRKVISILLALVLCLALATTAFATDDGFVSSPGESGTPCDHNNTSVSGKTAATCTKPGHTGATVCDDCGEVLDKGSEVPATGHKFVDGVCTVCGAKDVPKTGDNNNMVLWIALMAVSATALVAVNGIRRKQA